jgi:hypothetical protein
MSFSFSGQPILVRRAHTCSVSLSTTGRDIDILIRLRRGRQPEVAFSDRAFPGSWDSPAASSLAESLRLPDCILLLQEGGTSQPCHLLPFPPIPTATDHLRYVSIITTAS